jgi:ketosteroid isomerase-like protein
MNTESNKNIALKFWENFSAGNYPAALDMLSADATWWVAGSTSLSGTYSKTEFTALLEQVTPLAPDGLTVTPTLLTAEDNRVSVEAKSYGEITNGKTYQNIYHFMMVINAGKIDAVREYLDTEHVTSVFG